MSTQGFSLVSSLLLYISNVSIKLSYMKKITGTQIHCPNSVQQRLRSWYARCCNKHCEEHKGHKVTGFALNRLARTCTQITETSRKMIDIRIKVSNAEKIQSRRDDKWNRPRIPSWGQFYFETGLEDWVAFPGQGDTSNMKNDTAKELLSLMCSLYCHLCPKKSYSIFQEVLRKREWSRVTCTRQKEAG